MSILKVIATVAGLVLFPTLARAETDIEKLSARAKQGDVASQVKLGQMYRWGVMVMPDGSRVEKNLVEAVRWLKEIAKRPDLHAKAMLAGIYSSYDYDQRDDAAAALLFAEIARSDDPDKELVKAAQYQLGMLLYQECTGYLISLDCGTNKTSPFKNYQSAAHWFEFAAKQGDRDAKFQLATMYEHGRGVPEDFMEATKLYQAAAEAGEEEAPVMLGELYIRMQNFVSAHMWFNLAAADNRYDAAERRDKVALRMTVVQIAEAQKLARDYRAAHPTGVK
jgi:TPR repeat protein